MQSNARLSQNRKHRFFLSRTWDSKLPMLIFIGLNPSIADATKDDPTIRRMIGFAKLWNYGGIIVLNVYSQIQTNPCDLVEGPYELIEFHSLNENENENMRVLETFKNYPHVIFAWGAFKFKNIAVVLYVQQMFRNAKCLGKNVDGSPKHPLYLKKDSVLIPF